MTRREVSEHEIQVARMLLNRQDIKELNIEGYILASIRPDAKPNEVYKVSKEDYNKAYERYYKLNGYQ